MLRALEEMQVEGVTTTIPYLKELVGSTDFRALNVSTTWIERRRERVTGAS
jgi:pyruvate carboxylase